MNKSRAVKLKYSVVDKFLIVMSSNSALASDVFVPITIDKNDVYSGIKKLLQVLRPSWSSENIKFKVRFL